MTPHETIPARFTRPARALDARRQGGRGRRCERQLAAVIDQDGLVLHYQPRRRLATGETVGAEALIRWPHRAASIASTRDSALVSEIGAWALRAACAEARHWPPSWTLCVGVSVRQIADGTLLAQLAAALQQSGLPAERLEIALAEAVLLDTDLDTLLTLAVIRDLGIGVMLDDFGVGAAGVSMLKRLPLTAIKLHRSLLRDLPSNVEDAVIARAVIDTARVLGLHVVADGVETERQLAFLCDAGCDEGQGVLVGPAMSVEQLHAAYPAARRGGSAQL